MAAHEVTRYRTRAQLDTQQVRPSLNLTPSSSSFSSHSGGLL